MRFEKTYVIEIINSPKIYYHYGLCFKDGGIYIKNIVDMNSNIPERRIEKIFFPLNMVQKIIFPENTEIL